MLSRVIRGAFRYITDSDFRFIYNAAHGKYNDMADDEYLKQMFKIKLGKDLDLLNPITFNEKLQWLKLYDRKPIYTTMVDKFAVKKYVAEIIGEQYIIPTLGVWNSAEEIDFNMLPDQFVLKCTHDSHSHVICRDKKTLNRAEAVDRLRKALKRDYYLRFREWPYKNVKPRVIAEAYLEDEFGKELRDYKVLCFNGVPKLIELHQGRFTDHQTQDFYDTNWVKTGISQAGLSDYQVTETSVPKPAALDEMLKLSAKLAKDISHVRIDWYIIRGRLYFGEITFYDGSGFDPFDNPADDVMLGNWIILPKMT